MDTLEKRVKEQLEILKEGTVDILPEGEFEKKLKKSIETGKPLRVKLGIDASGPYIHLGFAVVLRKLRQFQELGHTAVLIFGDFTGKIGDPSGRSKTRPQLTDEDVQRNLANYKEQCFKILIPEKTEIHLNGEWFDRMTAADVVRMAATHTVSRMLERDYFEKRFKEGNPIFLHEFLYPLFQGYDSVMVDADIELGGTDQTFNLLVGRDMQEWAGKEPQVIMTLPLLEGLDGKQKMSKSYGNYIGITESPSEMFGKVMSIPDELIVKYYQLTLFPGKEKIDEIKSRLEKGENPRDLKFELAKGIVELYHGKEAAEKAGEEFNRVFKKKGLPDDIPVYKLTEKKRVLDILRESGLIKTNSEGRRIIQQGGLKINGNVEKDPLIEIDIPEEEIIIQLGKRRFLKIVR